MTVVVTGSVAYDYIMSFPGRFKEHLLPHKIELLSVSFLVDSMRRQRGGCAPNIAYSLRLLGHSPCIMATAGQDFTDYRHWLEQQGIDVSGVRVYQDEFTASFFVSTDLDHNQIASFYTGAMSRAAELSFQDLSVDHIELAVISPNDPAAMVKYVRECKELGIPYVYDPSQQIVRLSGAELIEGAQGARLLVVNEYEFEMIKNKTGLSDGKLWDLAQTTIITRGERGSTIIEKGRWVEIPSAPPRQIVDPTGVGDAYRAGVIVGMLAGFPWEVAGRIGSLAATYVLEQHGTQNHRYTLPEFIERYRQVFGDAPELARLVEQAMTR
ncbi:MAG: carbohydrate kinase family protein [Anaerolineae bacterium]|nr:carbohydrate kinase family protein [Anaerolineae bacterium]MDW8098380.1 carbohydrate kinase family protein [Anaerolineae bacterium]